MTLLLVLAKDPARLRANLAPVDLSRLVPSIVRDHAHPMQGKELSFVYGSMPAVEVRLPAPIAQAAAAGTLRRAAWRWHRPGSHHASVRAPRLDTHSRFQPRRRNHRQVELQRVKTGFAREISVPPSAFVSYKWEC